MIETFRTPAKINIYLKIGEVDPEKKLHFIDSIMVPVSLYDTISVKKSNVFNVETLGINENIPTEKNLVYKIWKETETYIGRSLPKFHVTIEKQVPNGAGLGGGSSNGAGFLLFLNRHLGLGLKFDELVEIALKAGSDVPFFLMESPAIVGGTGDKLKKIDILPQSVSLLLVCPEITVDSGLAYSLYDKKKLTKTGGVTINTVRNFDGCSLKDWTAVIYNDFEDVVFSKWPETGQLKDDLERVADKAFMSGSGSTVIGIFSSSENRDAAFESFSQSNYRSVEKIKLLT